MTEHVNLPDSELHEPKGVASATSNQVYVSDGATSGSWSDLEVSFSALIDDVSTSDTVYIPIPYAGTISSVVSVLEGSLTTADATVTVRNSAGSSMGTLTITQSGSAAGDVDTLSPASNNTVSANSFITAETDGASGTARKLWVTVILQRS